MSEIQRGMAWRGVEWQDGSLKCPARSQVAPDWTALLSLSCDLSNQIVLSEAIDFEAT